MIRSMLETLMSRQWRPVRFLLTGGTATLIYALLAALVATCWPQFRHAAGVLVYVAMIPLSFTAQRLFVFQSSGPALREFLLYGALQVGAVSAASAIISRFASGPFLWAFFVFVLNAIASAVVSYVLCSLLIFCRRRGATDQTAIAARGPV